MNRKLKVETKHTVSDGKIGFHKEDVVEILSSVAKSQVDLQAKELADPVNLKLKNINRGKARQFTTKSGAGKAQWVAGKEGRKILEVDSDDETLASMDGQRKKMTKKSNYSATRTGTTPPSTPSKSKNDCSTANHAAKRWRNTESKRNTSIAFGH